MAKQVAGETYFDIDGQLHEIKRQLRQTSGYPFDPTELQKSLQRVIEGKFEDVMAKTSEPKQRVEKSRVLKALDGIIVGPLTQAFDSRKFFKTRKGLCVSDEFIRHTKDIGVAESAEAAPLKRFDLVMRAYDREIKAELSEKHEVQLWQIAKLIEAQEDGTSGPLLTNGYANIFYVAGFVVRVSWYGGSRRWDVDAWRLGGDHWDGGHRAFSSN